MDYFLQQMLILVEYTSDKSHLQHLHIPQSMRLYVFSLLGIEFSTEQVVANAHQSQSALSC